MSSQPTTFSLPDAPEISCVEFLDQIFSNISSQIITIEGELRVSAAGSDITQIKELHDSVTEIQKNTACVSELTVKMKEDRNLLTNINAKLATTAQTLQGVNRLIAKIKDLETEIINGEFDYYRILAEMFSEVLHQKAQFDCYGALPYIKLIQAKVAEIEAELKRKVQWSVREIGQLVHGDAEVNPNSPGPDVNVDQETIGQVYLVVDVLGLAFRKDLSQRIAQLQLIPYEKAFQFGTKFCGIDHLEKRFVWFRMLLKVYESKLGHLFPKKWCLPHYFFIEFSRRTKKHIEEYLAYQEKVVQGGDIQDRVHAMLLSLKSLISFEAEMKAYFTFYIKGEDIDASILDVKEPMAEAYDPYLGPYIQVERMDLEALMEKISIDEKKIMDSPDNASVNLSVPQPAFESSQKMFEFIKASLKRCNTFSSGVTYLALSKEFRICLHNYALSLKFRHPSPVSAKAGERPVYEISKYMEVQLCRLIKTCEYCIDTIPQLEEKMKEHVDEEFKSEIIFTNEIDIFQSVITDTIALVDTGILEKIYPLLGKQGMRSIDWSKDQNVGDESKYMKSIFLILNDTIPRIRINLSSAYFQQFCMKLSVALIDAIKENIWKLKHISQTGSGQLLLDLNGLQTYLLNMPHRYLPSADQDKYPISKVYKSTVTNSISKIEIILKLVCTEDDQFEDMFKLLWPDGSKKDHDDIAELRARAGFIPHAVKDGVKGVKDAIANTAVAKDITQGIKSGTQKLEKGATNTFGDLKAVFSMNLFDDVPKQQPQKSPVSGAGGSGGAARAVPESQVRSQQSSTTPNAKGSAPTSAMSNSSSSNSKPPATSASGQQSTVKLTNAPPSKSSNVAATPSGQPIASNSSSSSSKPGGLAASPSPTPSTGLRDSASPASKPTPLNQPSAAVGNNQSVFKSALGTLGLNTSGSTSQSGNKK